LAARVVFGRVSSLEDGGEPSTDLRRRAGRLGSQADRDALLQSHAQLALLMEDDRNANYSLSRRAGYFAAGVYHCGKIGVDVEQVIQTDDIGAVAACYFSIDQYQTYLRLSEIDRPCHFAAGWSALEAVAKLRSIPLEEAGVELVTAVLYQCWIAADVVLSVALDQDEEINLISLAGGEYVFARI
jgi:hypothetical protein